MESLISHVMLVSFPPQGHINPSIRLGKLVASKGLLVTFVTTEEPLGKDMRQANKIEDGVLRPVGSGFLRFEFLAVGALHDIGDERAKRGKQEIKKLLKRYEEEGKPVTSLINDAYEPWAYEVAEELQIPSAVLWILSSACFATYYYYHHKLAKFPTEKEPNIGVEVPFEPFMLKYDEIHTFLNPSLTTAITFGHSPLEQMGLLLHKRPLSVLIDTFQELEGDIIDNLYQLCPDLIVKPIGPLFMMSKSICTDVKADISEPTGDCLEWLDSREPSSVVYIAFGTVVPMKQEQMNEIAHGLLDSGLSFLWVVRPRLIEDLDLESLVFSPELQGKGKIVEWCPQERVLAHPAIACFLSHCGWNSTMEALSSGVPVVCFPQSGDQVTNALYMVDVFKTGVRLGRGEAEGKICPREVVAEKLLEATSGAMAVELRKTCRSWKEKAHAAVEKGGSSDRSLCEFVDKLVTKTMA